MVCKRYDRSCSGNGYRYRPGDDRSRTATQANDPTNLELGFLNHHIRNAITQMSMAEYIADPRQHERLVREAVGRISEALFRIANSADLTGLSLEVDLKGTQLTHEGEAREQEENKKVS